MKKRNAILLAVFAMTGVVSSVLLLARTAPKGKTTKEYQRGAVSGEQMDDPTGADAWAELTKCQKIKLNKKGINENNVGDRALSGLLKIIGE